MLDTTKYTGIPFKTRSFDKKEGLDCLTFVLYFLEQEYNYKFNPDNIPMYGTYWYLDKKLQDLYIKNLRQYCELTPFDNNTIINIGDLLLFSYFNEAEAITHVGIYIGDNKFIHCIQDVGSCVTNLRLYKRALKWVGVVKDVKDI